MELRHLLIHRLSKAELLDLIELIRMIKKADKEGAPKTAAGCITGDAL
jgi:hypothetical protein